jgi:hypothetical protein
VFLSVLLHDFTVQEVTFECKGCVCNPFRKKTTVCRNALLDELVAANIILAHYKARDGVLDGEGLKKRIAGRVLRRYYNKAKKDCPEIDAVAAAHYGRLYEMERQGVAGLDRVADCFARMLSDVAAKILRDKASDDILKLCYNVGKFVYLADALDDVDEDFKKKRYNPFLAVYGDYVSRRSFFEAHRDELTFALAVTVNRAIECFNRIAFTQSHDLLRNIIHKGMRSKVDQLFESTRKLPKPKL